MTESEFSISCLAALYEKHANHFPNRFLLSCENAQATSLTSSDATKKTLRRESIWRLVDQELADGSSSR
jgi:hypothetical protein